MIECIDFKIYSLKYISVKAHYGASQCSLSGNIFLKPRPVIQFGPCVILLSRGSSYRYVRINTSSRRRKDTHLRVILQQNRRGAVALLHFSPSKMSTTVDPQRTAQIREVLAQTLSPDAATRRTVSFVVRHISIDSIRFRHHIIQHIRFSRSNLSPHLFLLACCAYHCFTFATGRATSDRGAEGGRPPAGRPSHCRE